MKKELAPFMAALNKFVEQHGGSQKAAAKSLGIKPAYLCDILKSRRPISENIAKKLGFEWKLVER